MTNTKPKVILLDHSQISAVIKNGGAYWLVCPEARRNASRIRAFRDWIKAEMAALA